MNKNAEQLRAHDQTRARQFQNNCPLLRSIAGVSILLPVRARVWRVTHRVSASATNYCCHQKQESHFIGKGNGMNNITGETLSTKEGVITYICS